MKNHRDYELLKHIDFVTAKYIGIQFHLQRKFIQFRLQHNLYSFIYNVNLYSFIYNVNLCSYPQ